MDEATVDPSKPATFTLRRPEKGDGAAMHRIARDSEALEENTLYAYLLLSSHFHETSLVAERDGEVVGYVAAYRPPTHPKAVFVWQIGVDASARRRGLARRMLLQLLSLPECREVKFLESTVTPSNAASRGLFESAARELGVPYRWSEGFSTNDFGGEGHEREDLFRAGPMGDTR
jgi:L-2,4-diaminobutyric acid acetyltransferase